MALGAGVCIVAALLTTIVIRRSFGPLSTPTPPLPVFGQVTRFALTNQDQTTVTEADLRGSIWLADIIFTRCPGPCVRMTRLLSEIQAGLTPADPVRLVTLTADPAFDTPGVLRAYAARYGADPQRWHFLTGPKSDLYRLAMKDLLLSVEEGDPTDTNGLENLFIHSTRFILVDQTGALRGVYDGEDPASKPKIEQAIRSLISHPPQDVEAR